MLWLDAMCGCFGRMRCVDAVRYDVCLVFHVSCSLVELFVWSFVCLVGFVCLSRYACLVFRVLLGICCRFACLIFCVSGMCVCLSCVL